MPGTWTLILQPLMGALRSVGKRHAGHPRARHGFVSHCAGKPLDWCELLEVAEPPGSNQSLGFCSVHRGASNAAQCECCCGLTEPRFFTSLASKLGSIWTCVMEHRASRAERHVICVRSTSACCHQIRRRRSHIKVFHRRAYR